MPNAETTERNEYTEAVEEVWENRDGVATARKAYREAIQENDRRHQDETDAIGDARRVLEEKYNDARRVLNEKERAVNETHKAGQRAAQEAFKATVGPDVPITNRW